jgi:hypothetical protein
MMGLPELSVTDQWEAAYVRFETPEQEVRKFLGRLRRLGAATSAEDAAVVELFCVAAMVWSLSAISV